MTSKLSKLKPSLTANQSPVFLDSMLVKEPTCPVQFSSVGQEVVPPDPSNVCRPDSLDWKPTTGCQGNRYDCVSTIVIIVTP